jgi:predicted ATPase
MDGRELDFLKNPGKYPMRERIWRRASRAAGGRAYLDAGDLEFSLAKDNGRLVSFAEGSSGLKIFSFIGFAAMHGRFDPGGVVFWDNPENGVDPSRIFALSDIILDIARSGCQVFITTHSELLANCLSVTRQKTDDAMFHAIFESEGRIQASSNRRFDFLDPNILTKAAIDLYEIEMGLGMDPEERD